MIIVETKHYNSRVGNKHAKKHDINDEILHDLRRKGFSFPMISRELGISKDIIKYHMNRLGYKKSIPEGNLLANRKYKYDITYFNTIDSEDKAYFLGLLYADGCNMVNENGSHKIQCTLHKEDAYLLEQFKYYSKNEHPLRFPNNKDVAIFFVSGIQWSEQLTKLGCIYRKSLILKFPTEEQVPYDLIHHFIRGYFDGDGCVHKIVRYNFPRVHICGTYEFCNSLKNLLEVHGIISGIYKQGNIFITSIIRKASVENFYKFIYKESSIKMERKFEIFNKIYTK